MGAGSDAPCSWAAMPYMPGAPRPTPRGTQGFEKIFVCCSASQKGRNFKFSPVEPGWWGASMCRCSLQGRRGQGGWQCLTAAHCPPPSCSQPGPHQWQDGHEGQLTPQNLARKG